MLLKVSQFITRMQIITVEERERERQLHYTGAKSAGKLVVLVEVGKTFGE